MHPNSKPIKADSIPQGAELLSIEDGCCCYRATINNKEDLYLPKTVYFHVPILFSFSKGNPTFNTYLIRYKLNNKYLSPNKKYLSSNKKYLSPNNKYVFVTCTGERNFFKNLAEITLSEGIIDRVTLDGKEIPVNKKVKLNE